MTSDGASDHGRAAVVLRPLASPLPVTLLALAVASLVLSGQELGWYAAADKPLVGWILLAFPAPIQLIAMAWAFTTRSAPATAAAAVLGAAWLSIGLVLVHGGIAPKAAAPLGVLQLGVGGALLLVATLQGSLSSVAPAAAFGLAAVRFQLSGIFAVSGAGVWQDVAGVAGLVVTALAGYAALATMLEDSLEEEVVPVGRRAVGARAVHGPLEAQLDGVGHEPGVRRVL